MVAKSLASTLFPKSRRMVFGLLMSHPDRAFYLREIAELTHLGIGHLQRELNRLVAAGIIRRFKRGRHVYFQADPACPVFDELRGIVIKTIGIAESLRQALLPLRDRIHTAFIFGSVARKEEHSASDVDLMVIGEVSLADVVDVIRDAEQRIARPVNPTVYPPQEFAAKLAAGHHFVTKVAEREKLILIGDESDLAALCPK
jgi:predicted nucleotidyltransferase